MAYLRTPPHLSGPAERRDGKVLGEWIGAALDLVGREVAGDELLAVREPDPAHRGCRGLPHPEAQDVSDDPLPQHPILYNDHSSLRGISYGVYA